MSMSRKDYEAIAEILRSEREYFQGESDLDIRALGTLTTVSARLSLLFAQGNPNFDREKFLKACGLDLRGE